MKELNKFYSNLYTSRNPEIDSTEFQNLLNTPGLKTLSELEKLKCEGEVKILANCR